MNKPQSLYIHIPFCTHICAYCDFPKVFYNEKWADAYLECLKDELVEKNAFRPFNTVYIGGGSPSSLNVSQLETLLKMIEPMTKDAIEVTLEANPEDLDERKVCLMAKYHITRVSLGVQTFNENLLHILGRQHKKIDVIHAVECLRKYNILNISFDFMYGLPTQTKQNVLDDLQIAMTFPIKHMSLYSLILEEHTRFYNEHINLMNEEWIIDVDDMIIEFLNMKGFNQYEVSNYAIPTYESKHNLVYWKNEPYIGVGCGASGYIGNIRYDNTRSLNAYLRHENKVIYTTLDKDDECFEWMMMQLRLVEGLDLIAFKNYFQKTVDEVYPKQLKWMKDEGYLIEENGFLKCTKKGYRVLDELLIRL